MKTLTFLNLKLNETYECENVQKKTQLKGKVIDISREHAKLEMSDGTEITLTMQSDVSRCNSKITFY